MSQAVDVPTVQPATVVKQGLLRKLKTMKKRYFVLRGDSPGSPARLEYYTSEKKFKDGKSQPRKAVELRSCLGIGATASARVSFAIAVHTRDDWLAVGFDSESDRDDWLAAARRLLGVGGGKCGGDVGAPMFEHVWIINLRPKGLGRGLAGLYRLCLTDRTLSLVKRASSEANLTFPLEVMRRCGHTDNFFFVEVGRQASTGEGELWMEAEDALIAQSAHYAVQRAMHATKDGVTISSSSPITASTSAALPAGSTAAAAAAAATKALDGGSADHRQGSESSSGGEAAAVRRPEADLSPSQPSRFSTAAISLLTRRLSSKSKPASAIAVPASGGAAPASGSIIANGGVSASTNGHDWSAPAADTIEREARLLSISKLDRPAAAVVAGAAAIRRNSSSSSSHCRAGCRDASIGELATRGGSPVPVIEITAVSKESDDPYFEMSAHDLSAGAGHTAGADYMDMTPRSAASSTETALAPIFVPVDDNYLAMLPGRGIGAIGSMHSSPATAAASAPDNLPTPDASLLFGPVTPACQQRSPRCHSRDGGSCGRMAPKGSQQLLLPDLFSLMPGAVVGSGGTGSPTSTNLDSASAARSSASLGVPHTHWSDGGNGSSSSRGTGDSLGASAGTRLRAGSDAPTHRGKAAKQRSGEPAPPDQRQRSSSQGCVPASLGAFGQSILRPAVARGLSDESAASSVEAEPNRAVGVSLPGSYEYVAIDFAEPARTGAEPAAATAGSGATIAAAHEQHPPRPAATAAVTLAGRQHLPPSIVVASSASSHGWPELGDYVGIDFGKASAQASGSTGGSGSPWPAKMLPDADAAAADDLMSEPFPELATVAVPKPHGNTSQQRVVTSAVAAGAASTSAVSASQAAHARNSSLPSADGLHHAAGSSPFEPTAAAAPVVGGSLLLLTPAPKFGLDHRPKSAHGEAYVMFSRASARCSATNDRSEAPEHNTVEARQQQQHGDAYAELDPPTGRGSRLEALLPSQGCGTVFMAASTADCTSGDSYAVMNFSSDAVQQLALSPLPPQPSTAKVVAAATLASTGEQPDLGGELAHCDEGGWRGAQSPSRPSSSAGAAATAFSSAVSMGGGSGGSLRLLPAFGGGGEAMQPASSANRLAMPVRATCYIKDDDEDDGRDVRGGCSSCRAAPIDQMFTGSAVQRSQKSGASRAAAAAAAARPRPSSVSYPACAQPPPLPARSAPPTAASAAGSKPRHSSGSGGGEPPLVTAINYASLDLGAEFAPRTSAAAVAARPLARPSSGGSLLSSSSSSSCSSSDSGGGARSVPAGSGVQYSRIDFAKVESLKAGKI